MFGRKKAIDDMTTEEIEKYLEERKSSEESKQSLEDRVDESVAEQEKEAGDEDEQNAKDRVDEALGEDEKSEEEAEESEEEELSEEKEDNETEEEADEWRDEVDKKISDLYAMVEALKKSPKEADDTVADKLTALERKFS